MSEFYMTPDYGYEPFTEMPGATSEAFGVVGALLGVMAVFYLLIFAFGIVSYILQSIGIYTVAKRRGIHNPWLAWIPVGVLWILGSISDQYQYVVKGRVRNRRKVLLGLSIAIVASSVVAGVSAIVMAVAAIVGDSATTAGVGILLTVLFYLAVVVSALILTVYTYIVLYDLFASCDPYNATTYLVLSIFFSVAMPFFIFFSRKKDGGMPPRKAEPQPAPRPVLPVVEQAPAEETPVAESPAEEPQVEENPVEENPVEENPVEENPVEE